MSIVDKELERIRADKEGIRGFGMKTLEQHNDERWNIHREMTLQNKPHPNGIECPKCGKELMDSNPMCVLTSNPPQCNVHCPSCGYTGFRLV